MSPIVAVTGIGLVTALGATREETWRRMIGGECGVRPVTVFGTTGYRSRVAAEVDVRDVDRNLGSLRLRRYSRGDRIRTVCRGGGHSRRRIDGRDDRSSTSRKLRLNRWYNHTA